MSRYRTLSIAAVALIALMGSGSACGAFGGDEPSTPSTAADGGPNPNGDAASIADGGGEGTDALVEGVDAGPLPCGAPGCFIGGACINDQCPEVFAKATAPVGVDLLGDGFVYFTEDSGGLYRKRKTDTDHLGGELFSSSPVPIPGAQYLTHQGDRLLWTRWINGSADPAILVATGPSAPDSLPQRVDQATGIAATSDGVVWVSSYGNAEIYRLDGTGAPTPAFTLDGGNIEAIATTGADLFAAWNTAGSIVQIFPSFTLTNVGGRPTGLVAQPVYFYGTDQDDGSVFKVLRTRGVRTNLAQVPGSDPQGIAMDVTHIYWAVKGAILRIRRLDP